MQSWIDKFQSAKAALASASVAAAAAAQATLQEAYEQCSRISLCLTLRVSCLYVAPALSFDAAQLLDTLL